MNGTAFVLSLALAPALQAPQHTKDSLDTVRKMLVTDRAVLIDVREQVEWDDGHIKDAVFLPLSKLREGVDPKEVVSKIPRDRIVYTHCASGRRCLPAAEILKKLGYDVRPLKAGYKDLVEAGFPKARQ